MEKRRGKISITCWCLSSVCSTHLIKKRVGLIRQDETRHSVSQQLVSLKVGKENRKKKEKHKNPVEEKNGGSGVASSFPSCS